MQLSAIFFQTQQSHSLPQRLRSGWRVVVYLALLSLPRLVFSLMPQAKQAQPAAAANATFALDASMAVVYALLIAWVVFISWLCLRWLEALPLRTLGYALASRWWWAALSGWLFGGLLIVVAVGLQWGWGASRTVWHPAWWQPAGTRWHALGATLLALAWAAVVLALAAAFEEILFRGYALQTLTRDVSVLVPLLLLSVLFGFAHGENPHHTKLATLNTVLAGIWLTVAWYKTRSLWFATGLHLGWNWTMGAVFGLPISGMCLERSLCLTMNETADWLTGGAYGCEGGASATIAFLLGICWLWQAPHWLFGLSPSDVIAEKPLHTEAP